MFFLRKLRRDKVMKINESFNERQQELLNNLKVDIFLDFDKESLEQLEDTVYDAMMDHLDSKQDFTTLAEEYERILDIIVDIENNL